GPNADSLSVLLGNYNGNPSSYTTILEGIRKRFRGTKILTARGAPVTETSAAVVPSEHLRTGGANSQPGLNAAYFANSNFSGAPVLKRVDASVDFEWINVSPGPGVPAGNYSIRWTGELVPPVDGDYRLGANADGGYRIYLDGKKFVDDSAPHGTRTMTTLVHLQAGHAYPIRIEYFHGWCEATARRRCRGCSFWRLQSGGKASCDILSIRRTASAVWKLFHVRPHVPLLHRAAALSLRLRSEFLVLQLFRRESKPGESRRGRHSYRLRSRDQRWFRCRR